MAVAAEDSPSICFMHGSSPSEEGKHAEKEWVAAGHREIAKNTLLAKLKKSADHTSSHALKNSPSDRGKQTGKKWVAVVDHEIATRTLLAKNRKSADHTSSTRKTCICSPTTHPGSFRCRLHRSTALIHTTKTKTMQTAALSRFARDVNAAINCNKNTRFARDVNAAVNGNTTISNDSDEKNECNLSKPQYHSE